VVASFRVERCRAVASFQVAGCRVEVSFRVEDCQVVVNFQAADYRAAGCSTLIACRYFGRASARSSSL
jgi:hypothetical protein